MSRRVRSAAFVLLVLSLAPRPAAAQSAEAQELFDQGRRALVAKDYASACKKLEASEQLERAVGTLLSLAECEEATGKLAAARLHVQEAASWAEASHDRLNRGPVALERFKRLDARVPRLTLTLAAGAPRDTRVRRDGIELGPGAFGVELPVDPGKHAIVVSAAGRSDATYEANLEEGGHATLKVAPGPTSSAETAGAPAAARRSPPDEARSSARRTWSYVAAGVGLAGIGVGTFFGLGALSTWSRARQDCGAGCPEGSPARSERSDALTDATISTISVVAGGAALAVGVYLFLTEPPRSTPAAGLRLAPWTSARGGAGGASLRGSW